ncbi:MAG: hypothetical protein H0T73_16585 [Ardenticatenales bacterium]|nr:hypothetical protein [Ardenticatenales bacterium]
MADILYLVERLEQVLAQGWRVPLTTNAVIDEDAFIDIVEQMHIAIPNEIRQAQQIVQQKERMLAQAREEADRILSQAREEADRLVTNTDVVERARDRAAEVIAQAQEEAREIRGGADGYSAEVLSRIRDELQVYLRQVDNGLKRLRVMEEPPPSATQSFDFEDGIEEEERKEASA